MSGFDSRRYQIFWVLVGLERGSLSLVRIIEELFRGNSGSGLENLNKDRGDSLRCPRDTVYPLKLVTRKISSYISTIYFSLALQPHWALVNVFHFHDYFTDGRPPLRSDQLFARPLPKHRNSKQRSRLQSERIQCMPWTAQLPWPAYFNKCMQTNINLKYEYECKFKVPEHELTLGRLLNNF
jgi:hypothetical protein